ncbi:hypothetical protein COY43_01325 [Candidatus Berkelbacteria bacterium CG_4_10_14_0_8_um_filter_35_9_33_8]|uniref:Uncharacterized protein n=1 Tax=Candidatus Berkelbacteria bacterium CG_4_10_14_0_2_um_filter_35_9_33_12 TaxID=1974499 RepID=A0A2M7W4B5_9BACT|nr:MAG: hypothetical protein COX10_02605 [Candidatus Berkelbacteria bacterium CG23_combo_of_CG06-09_8_20_14_all_33_15]PIS08653.1 MAG: hypothetical protein COT76_00035 [Candidatus Berkelbacteria bacterium CG10_big_fil_rev_8_21_14_0_10_33_10]PIZ28279.1 MAG: hypothetical protein COY43_01325 [Candidatus Berkelbacteria bacterium CG_4_10_14_0_8_um_filter_35_9_33_8]PJA20568.1 MAG: hypothetical protein COX60_01320 [Candidatus Berkelbacteria bacterium CG_4_10_14_0_2_um_filter_35_9_33_12]
MKVLCPKDGQIMCPVDVSQQSYECFVCHYVWSRPMKETKKISNYQVGSLHKYISLVFIVALSSVFLLSVQMSKLSSFADTQTIEKSVKLSALIIWWLVFMLLFSLPISIYYQMVIKKQSVAHSIRTPWSIGVPLTVIVLELLNVLLIFPIIKL